MKRILHLVNRIFHELARLAVSAAGWPLRLAVLKWAQHFSLDCRPLRTNAELLAYNQRPFQWPSLVDRLDTSAKGAPRLLGNGYEDFDGSFQETSTENEAARPKVLVCHDLAGNYRDDRFIRGSTKWDEYRFYHWAGIDYFCYFSHDYITVPTFAWIQAAHRHGVPVLGTVIFESAPGQRLLVEVLRTEESMHAVVEALVYVARHCCFEGWLLNVECTLERIHVPMLRRFVERLTQRTHDEIPHGVVFWYDSIIESGQLRWQNELNDKNKMFFDVCDGMLVNYTWNEFSLEHSASAVAGVPSEMAKIFVGIDVFGRGQVAGFDCNKTLARIRHHNFSVGIFAPGWTFEAVNHLGINIKTVHGTDVCNRSFIERNNRFWALLWPSLYTSTYGQLPFYSSFCLGSGKQTYLDGILSNPTGSWFNLNRQAIQPSVPQQQISYNFEDSFNGGCSVKVHSDSALGPRRLFVVDWPLDRGLIVAYAFKSIVPDEDVSLWLRVESAQGDVWRLECGSEHLSSLDVNRNVDNYRRLMPLDGDKLREVLMHIGTENEKALPRSTSNGWLVRYYYVNGALAILNGARVTDVGVLARYGGAGTYLGAVHMHRGSQSLNDIV